MSDNIKSDTIDRNIERHSGRYLSENEYDMFIGTIPLLNIEGRVINVHTTDGIVGQYYCTKDIENFIDLKIIRKILYRANIPMSERFYIKISKYTYCFISIGAILVTLISTGPRVKSNNACVRKVTNTAIQNIIQIVNNHVDEAIKENDTTTSYFNNIEKAFKDKAI